LADIGSTLRSCTNCAMPPEVRTSIDAIVATTDRILDEMATQLRTEAANLAQRAVIAANDMLTAAGYPPLPGATTATTTATTATIGGNTWGAITIENPHGTLATASQTVALRERIGGQSIVGGSWTPGLEITITNPDGTPSEYTSERLDAMLRAQSVRTVPRRHASPIDNLVNSWALQPITGGWQNDVAYNQWPVAQNQIGLTPPPQHQSPYRSLP
jgi:hypothetical protein